MTKLMGAVVMAFCGMLVHAAEIPKVCGMATVPAAKQAMQDLSGKLPVADYLDVVLACTAGTSMADPSIPKSDWLAADSRRFAAVLGKSKYPLLVLPAQTQYYGFDLAERSLISAEIAAAFFDQGTMPDPLLVARALGEVRRRYATSEIDALTAATGAARRVDIFVGHDQLLSFTLTLRLNECTAGTKCRVVKQFDWRGLKLSQEEPPFRVVHALRADIRRQFLGASAGAPREPALPTVESISGVTPAQVMNKTYVPTASVTALLAGLAPTDPELPGNRLNLASLRVWSDAPPRSAGRVYAALAAANLQRPLIARGLIVDFDDPAAITLRKLLDENLAGARKSIQEVRQPLQRLLLEFRLQDLAYQLGKPATFDATLLPKVFGAGAEQWRPLVMRRVHEGDGWARSDARVVKSLFDTLAPAANLKLNSLVVGSTLVAGEPPDDTKINLANFRHADFALEVLAVRNCCAAGPGGGAWQMYWLLEGIAQADALRQIELHLSVLGLPEQAKSLVDRYEAVLGGHPSFEVQRLSVLSELASKADNAESQRIEKAAQQARDRVSYWAQGQSRQSLFVVLSSSATLALADAYSRDFPRRSYWMDPAELQEQQAVAVAAPPAARKPAAEDQRKLKDARTRLRADQNSWDALYGLGLVHLQDLGNAQEAQRTFLSYPGFKDGSGENAVGLSNDAYISGSDLYWLGWVDLARPLYQVAADLDTGSAASLVSAARLAQLDHDYETATEIFLQAATRYSSAYQYRDALSLLYVTGHEAEADSAFGQIAQSFELPQVWLAAWVGKHKAGMTYEEMKKWVLSAEIRNARYRGRRFAPYFALVWATTDRKPPADFAAFMEQVERDAVRTMDSGFVLRPSSMTEGNNEIVMASAFRQGKASRLPTGTRVKSEFVLLADALTTLHAGNFGDAVRKFDALADRYSLEKPIGMSYVLPYYARAAAKTGDADQLEKFLWALDRDETDFDVLLSRATFAAVRRQAGEAERLLARALRFRPHSEDRPLLTEYQYAEVCEFVATETGDARFTRMLLDWARRQQLMQPTHAWGYTLEAQYSSQRVEADRALAMALYLDPASPRLAQTDAKRRAVAQAWLKANNPFRKPAAPPDPRTRAPAI